MGEVEGGEQTCRTPACGEVEGGEQTCRTPACGGGGGRFRVRVD